MAAFSRPEFLKVLLREDLFSVTVYGMTISLNKNERVILRKLQGIKKISGSHSPSPSMLKGIAGVEVKHDFCYLSNPHATDLFLKYFRKDFRNTENLRKLVELYPSQNRSLALKAGKAIGVPAKNIFVGNGATEIIQAVLQNFVKRKILVPVPTFSPYLEFTQKEMPAVRHQLLKEKGFRLDTQAFLTQVKKEKPDAIVLISPNNPEGGHLSFAILKKLLDSLKSVQTVIIDESFIHFTARKIESTSRLVLKYRNLIVVKSLSKDFGIAGLRLGYAAMSEDRVNELLGRGYLWNVSGFGEYFLELLNQIEFLKEYEKARLLCIKERDEFFTVLSRIKSLKVYPSKANAFLLELTDGSKATDLVVRLLVKYGIYVRLCKDKVGLEGEFIRVASRSKKENDYLTKALLFIFRAV